MVLLRTESTQYNTNNSFGEIIRKFQDYNIKKTYRLLKEKRKNSKTRRILFYLIKPVYLYIYIYIPTHPLIYIYIYIYIYIPTHPLTYYIYIYIYIYTHTLSLGFTGFKKTNRNLNYR